MAIILDGTSGITTPALASTTLTSPVIAGTPTGVGVLTSGTVVASTSGTSIDFTGIPSWAKRITVMFSGVSTSSTSNLLVQIGSSSGIENTNYFSAAGVTVAGAGNAVNFTTGFGMEFAGAATAIRHGTCELALFNANLWTQSSNISLSDSARANFSAGTKSLSGVLDRVRITTVNGTDTFDAGSINILYE
jgi:hypothetical protein